MNDSENSYENARMNSNNFEASEPTQPLDFNSVEDVCNGVILYRRYKRLSGLVYVSLIVICGLLLICFPALTASIIFAGIILFSPQPIKEPVSFSKVSTLYGVPLPDMLFLEQMSPEQLLQWSRFVFIAVYLAIFAFYGLCLCVPIYNRWLSCTRLLIAFVLTLDAFSMRHGFSIQSLFSLLALLFTSLTLLTETFSGRRLLHSGFRAISCFMVSWIESERNYFQTIKTAALQLCYLLSRLCLALR